MKKDYIITFVTEFLILISGIVVYKLAAMNFGKEGFSEYALGMKTTALIQPILLIGLNVGIPRYIAYSQMSEHKEEGNNYFIGGLISNFLLLAVFLFILNIFKDFFAFLFFGDNQHVGLILPLSILLLGLSFHIICYSYFRGHIQMSSANILRLLHGLTPLVVLFYFGNQVPLTLMIIGFIWFSIALLSFFFIFPNIKIYMQSLYMQTKELLRYGIRRLPADVLLSAILILPATFTAHIAGVKEAGFIAFGISALSMSAALFAPIGLVLLPKASRTIAQNNIASLKEQTIKILIGTIILAALMVFLFIVFAELIITIYLGNAFIELVDILRLVVIGIFPFSIYVCMRSVIDAYYEKAINTKNVTIAFMIFLFGSALTMFLTREYLYILYSLILGLSVLGILTLYEIRTILRIKER